MNMQRLEGSESLIRILSTQLSKTDRRWTLDDFGWTSSPPAQVVQEVPDEDLPELDSPDCCRCLMTFSDRVRVDEGYEMFLRQCLPFPILSEVMKKRSKMRRSASRLVMRGRMFYMVLT